MRKTLLITLMTGGLVMGATTSITQAQYVQREEHKTVDNSSKASAGSDPCCEATYGDDWHAETCVYSSPLGNCTCSNTPIGDAKGVCYFDD